MLRSDGLKMQLFSSATGLAASAVFRTDARRSGRQRHELTFKKKRALAKILRTCRLLRFTLKRLAGVQLHLAAEEELWTSAGWPPAMFSLQACRGELWCYFPFHTSVRGQTQPPPSLPRARPLFCGGIPCLGCGWLPRTGQERASCLNGEQFRNRVRGAWFSRNCSALSPRNEASEVIKMLSVLSKS